jgi:predicted enzyme related to lactoylglutathione lyase
MARIDDYAPGQFCWVDLAAHDLPVAVRFYEQLFGWTAEEQDTRGGPRYVQLYKNGASVAGVGQMSGEMMSRGVPPAWNSYVRVEDVDAVLEKVAVHGGTVTVPAMDILDVGRTAWFTDPTGAQLALWKPGRHAGCGLANEPGSFCWNELASRDIHRAAEFFGAVFGWDFEENPASPTPYLIVRNQGRHNGGLIQMNEEWGEMPPHWIVYFAVEEAQAAVARLKEAGGTLHHGPFDTPAGPLAVCADPQGAPFHLVALKEGMTGA